MSSDSTEGEDDMGGCWKGATEERPECTGVLSVLDANSGWTASGDVNSCGGCGSEVLRR